MIPTLGTTYEIPDLTIPLATKQVGVSGLDFTTGYLKEDFISALQTARQRYKVYDEMRRNSPVIAAALRAIELPLRAAEWHIEGDNDDPRVEFLEQCLADMTHSWVDHVTDALTMIPFGFSLFETVYKVRRGEGGETESAYNDGRLGWARFGFRSQGSIERWQFDNHGVATVAVQRTYPDFRDRPLPLNKVVHYVTSNEKGNPEGMSLLRPAYVPYYYLSNLQTVQAIGLERNISGYPMITIGEGEPNLEAAIAEAMRLVRRVRGDEQGGIVLPPHWGFQLVSSTSTNADAIEVTITRLEQRIAMSLLSQFLMLGADGVGSYALSKDQSALFVLAITAFADTIAETFTQQAIKPLLKLNGFSVQDMPVMAHGKIEGADLGQLASLLQVGVQTGIVVPDADMEAWYRDVVGIPARTDERPDTDDGPSDDDRREAMSIGAGVIDEQAFHNALYGATPETYSYDQYRRAIGASVRGLWSGRTDAIQFDQQMTFNVTTYLTRAFSEGAAEFGITPADMTAAELAALRQLITEQLGYLGGFAQDITRRDKASGADVGIFETRVNNWANRYNDAYERGKMLAARDRLMLWIGDKTRKKPTTSASFNGVVKRASEWNAAGYFPGFKQAGCQGFGCKCQLVPTTSRRTPGPMPRP